MFCSPSTNARSKSSPDCKRSLSEEKPKPVPPNAIPMGRSWNKTDDIAALHAAYQQIVEDNAEDYAQADSKKMVSQRIATLLEAKGIRFVRWNPKNVCWEDAPTESAINKISAACRQWRNTKESSLQHHGKPKKVKGTTKKDVCNSLSKNPNSAGRGIPTGTTTDITTSSELTRSSRRPSPGAATTATVAIAQSSKTVRSQQSKVASQKSPTPTKYQIVKVNDATAWIQNNHWDNLVAHLSPECPETALQVIPKAAVFQPNPSSPYRKFGCNWVEPQHSKGISNKRGLSTRYPTRRKKARTNSDNAAEGTDSQNPANTTLLQVEFQPAETSSYIKSVLSIEDILTPIDGDKETEVEKSPGEESIVQDCVTPNSDIDRETQKEELPEGFTTNDMDVLFIPSDVHGSPREIKPWWSGMQTNQSPFLVGTDSLFDHRPSESLEPSSLMGLSATLDLFSDFEETLEHSTLLNLSPNFSMPPCQFENLEDFDSTSNSVDVEVLASPSKLEVEATAQVS